MLGQIDVQGKAGHRPMKVLVMGAGGIGAYIGARLAAAGDEVVFVARGAHLAALQGAGLRVESRRGDLALSPVRALAEPPAERDFDLILFTVKGFDAAAAADRLAPAVGLTTAILSLLNGVEAVDLLAERHGVARVLGGSAYFPAVIAAPGVIRHTGPLTRTVLGELAGGVSPRVELLARRFRDAGVDAEISDRILVDLWHKFVMLAAYSAIACLTRLPLRGIMGDAETAALYRQGMEETAAVARARGIGIAADIVERNFDFSLRVADPDTRASMLEDLERGRPIEVAHLSGHVAAEGRRLGVPTPFHRMAWQALHPYIAGRG